MTPSNRVIFVSVTLLVMGLLLASPFMSWTTTAAGSFQKGDVFLNINTQTNPNCVGSTACSTILWLRPVGNTCPVSCLVMPLAVSGISGEGDGMAFDKSGNLYATEGFAANTIVKFDNTGTFLGTFGGTRSGHPESLVFDSSGNLYVGLPDSSPTRIDKLDSSGTTIASFTVNKQYRGSDWLDLGSDQCTMYYTSEGNQILKYNACTSTQLTPITIASSSIGTCYAHRLIPSGTYAGDDLVACSNQVVLIDSSGNV
ncbi:MAG: hypothetical protein M1368_06895, partial [Thaumarchaeota archaeon]|nr:hypothetical protein [Nitrososphaerota archaeon]